MNDKFDRLELVRSAWDAYDPDYMEFPLQVNPDFHKDFAEGAMRLNPMVTEIVGDVGGDRNCWTSAAPVTRHRPFSRRTWAPRCDGL